MKALLALLFLFVPALRAEPPAKPVAVLSVGTRVFHDATVRKLDAFTARITHASGVATVSAWEFSEAQQRSFGFDPTATAAERARREEAARVAEAARQREAARVVEAARLHEAAIAADAAAAARMQERKQAEASRKAAAEAEAGARAKEQYNREREALLNFAIEQSESRDRLPLDVIRGVPATKWVKKDDLPILRRLFSSGASVEQLYNLYQIPH